MPDSVAGGTRPAEKDARARAARCRDSGARAILPKSTDGDGAPAAPAFRFRTLRIGDVKRYLGERGPEVRFF